MLHNLKAQSTPITPHYLVKTKQPVGPNEPAKAELREERIIQEDGTESPTTKSYHEAQEMRLMHEFKEAMCEILPSKWDDK